VKMILLVVAGLTLAFFLVLARPAFATDNTSIAIGFSENISFGTISVSAGDSFSDAMQEAMEGAVTAFMSENNDHQDEILATIVGFLVCILISAFAIWKENHFIYMMAFLVDIMFGLTFASQQTVKSVNWVVGLVFAVIGTYFLFHVAWRTWQKRRVK